jgi:hypothetical protein
MTWEEKLSALQVLCDTSLRMRKPGDWYVSATGREIGGDDTGMLTGLYGNGPTPQAAVEDDWKQMTELPVRRYIVIGAMGPNRKHFRWAGYMWREVPML